FRLVPDVEQDLVLVHLDHGAVDELAVLDLDEGAVDRVGEGPAEIVRGDGAGGVVAFLVERAHRARGSGGRVGQRTGRFRMTNRNRGRLPLLVAALTTCTTSNAGCQREELW